MAEWRLGRLQYLETNVFGDFGRALVPLIDEVRSRALGRGPCAFLDVDLYSCLDVIARMLILAEAMVVRAWESERPCVVFKESTVEDRCATRGAVVVSASLLRTRVPKCPYRRVSGHKSVCGTSLHVQAALRVIRLFPAGCKSV
eukprot:3324211-Amphidinium_carterae.1